MLKNLDTVSMLFCDSTLQKYNVLSEVHIGAQKTPPPQEEGLSLVICAKYSTKPGM